MRSESIVDDMDGTSPASPRTFTVLGKTFDIDLCDANLGHLSSAINLVEQYVAVARPSRTVTAFSSLSPSDRTQIRRDLKKGPRARISDAEVEAWGSRYLIPDEVVADA